RPDLGESFPAEPDGDGTDRAHLTPARIGPAAPDLLHHAGGVRDGLGVRHRVHAREPARGRGPGSARDGLRVLPAGFAQVGGPGSATSPAASMTSAPPAGRSVPIAVIAPPSMRMSTGSPPSGRHSRMR